VVPLPPGGSVTAVGGSVTAIAYCLLIRRPPLSPSVPLLPLLPPLISPLSSPIAIAFGVPSRVLPLSFTRLSILARVPVARHPFMSAPRWRKSQSDDGVNRSRSYIHRSLFPPLQNPCHLLNRSSDSNPVPSASPSHVQRLCSPWRLVVRRGRPPGARPLAPVLPLRLARPVYTTTDPRHSISPNRHTMTCISKSAIS
jgi:hypothetical protein